jgi:hypothetical protein
MGTVAAYSHACHVFPEAGHFISNSVGLSQHILQPCWGDYVWAQSSVEIRVFATPTAGWLHVDILRFAFTKFEYVLGIPLE